jgi:C1A family cysteine protease
MKLYFYQKANKIKKEPIPKKRIYNIIINKSEQDQKLKLNFVNKLLPKFIDLRKKFPPVYDQGYLASCTACALCSIIQYLQPKFQGSRLFLYYNERKLENNIPDDTGATLSSGIECLLKYGVCPESMWPYVINKFAVKPDDKCYVNALEHQALKVNNINETLQTMKSSLANGNPFVVGFLVYQSFESINVIRTGIVPMPNMKKEQVLGGHAVVCVGYNDLSQKWIMRNSWGSSWGDKGYFYLPYNYLLNPNLSTDMWTITKME